MSAPSQAELQAVVALLNAGQPGKAGVAARGLIDSSPRDPLLHLVLGMALAGEDKLDAAIQSYRAALALKPDFFDAWNNLGVALHKQKKRAEAADCYQAALKLQPANADVAQNLRIVLSELGYSHLRQHRIREAVETFRKLLVLKPENPEVLFNLGGNLVRLEQFDEAIAFLNRLLERDPDNIRYLAYAAVAEKTRGRPFAHHLTRIMAAPSRAWKETSIQMWAALTSGLPEDAFRFSAEGLNVLDYPDLARLYRHASLQTKIHSLPVLQGSLPMTGSRPLIFAAADGVYAERFARDLIGSALSKSPGCDVHLHLMNPGSYEPEDALRIFPKNRVTWSAENIGPCDKTLYSTRRFVRLAQLLKQAGRLCIAVDVDAIFKGNVLDGLTFPSPFDAVIYRPFDEIMAHQVVKAGFLAVAPTAHGRDFVDFLASYILHFEELGISRWFVDQLAMIAAVIWFGKNVADCVVTTAPARMMDWKADDSPDALIWYYKGGQKLADAP